MNDATTSGHLRWMPLTVALCPVLYIYATNFASVQLRDLLLPLLVIVPFSLIASAVLRRLMADPEEAVLTSTWFVGGLFTCGIVFNVLNVAFQRLVDDRMVLPHKFALVGWFLIWIAGFVAILCSPWSLKAFNRFLFTMSLTFLALTGVIAARSFYSELSLDVVAPPAWSKEPIELVLPEDPPDVYFLVFDRYGGLETLRTEYEFDNSAFYEELQARDFEINETSCANYPRTLLSMTSALNCELLPDEAQNDRFYAELLNDHRVGRAFKKAGYKYVHLGNSYGPLRTNKHATSDLPPSFLPSEFADALYCITPFSRIVRPQDKYEFVKERFRRVATADGQGAPLFVYGHFLVPHNPYVFASDGSRLPDAEVAKIGSKKNYIGQLQATNRMILQTIDAILKKPGTEPIIVLLADEGPYLKQDDVSLPRLDRIRYRSRILSAMRLPERRDTAGISDSITPVNVFRFLFDRYFGTQLGLLPDRTYFWEKEGHEGQPAQNNTRFIDVTNVVKERTAPGGGELEPSDLPNRSGK